MICITFTYNFVISDLSRTVSSLALTNAEWVLTDARHQPGNTGGDWVHFNSPAHWPRRQRAALYGYNDIAVGKPNFLQMTAAQLAYPLFSVQVCLPPHDLPHACDARVSKHKVSFLG